MTVRSEESRQLCEEVNQISTLVRLKYQDRDGVDVAGECSVCREREREMCGGG